jgi:orotate phosphoribosyltransferase
MKKIAKGLLKIGAVKFNPDPKDAITFKSGIKSPVYCDNRLAYGDVDFRRVIYKALTKEAEKIWDAYDAEHGTRSNVVIVGVATGAIGWGFAVAEHYLETPFAYVRAQAKDHGLGKQIEGYQLKEGDKVIVIEDLISTGGSSLEAVDAVRATGAEVIGMVAIMTYGWETMWKAFEDAKVNLVTLTNYVELVDAAKEAKIVSEEEAALLDNWYLAPEEWGK